MLPSIVQRRIAYAEAVAKGLRDTAGYCTSDQAALRERFLGGAQAIDELVALLQASQFVAKLNHDTIISRNVL